MAKLFSVTKIKKKHGCRNLFCMKASRHMKKINIIHNCYQTKFRKKSPLLTVFALILKKGMNAQGRRPLFLPSFYAKPNIILWLTTSFMLSASLMNRKRILKYPMIMVFACKRDYLLSVKDHT